MENTEQNKRSRVFSANKSSLTGKKFLNKLRYILQTSVVLLCIYLIYIFSNAVIKKESFIESEKLMSTQFWICIYFIIVFFIEMFTAEKKLLFFRKNFIFLIISIPYISIISTLGRELDADILDKLSLIRYVPILRGGYAIALVVRWISGNRASSLLLTYILTLSSLVYFGSLIFYELESNINPNIHRYWDAAYWAMMNATTVGSYITAQTIAGQAISVVLSMFGMMLLPVFTIYVTHLIQNWK